jgi:NAD(P)-dependent dehydrogenase (short-subunit alcohol dehydrogenase family)
MERPTVLVTGAGSGLGLAVIEALAARDVQVVATARRRESTEMIEGRLRARGTPVTTDRLDVLDAASAAEVIGRHRPDVVVNNAGTAALGPLLEVDDEDAAAQFDLHAVAPVRLARLAAPHMRERGRGRIVNVSSALASTPLPGTGWYGAAKAALASLTDTLRVELAGDGIDVVLVDLGAVDTPIWDDAAEDTDGRWRALTSFARPLFTDVGAAASVVVSATCDEHPRWRYRSGLGATALALAEVLPRPVRDPIARAVFALG